MGVEGDLLVEISLFCEKVHRFEQQPLRYLQKQKRKKEMVLSGNTDSVFCMFGSSACGSFCAEGSRGKRQMASDYRFPSTNMMGMREGRCGQQKESAATPLGD